MLVYCKEYEVSSQLRVSESSPVPNLYPIPLLEELSESVRMADFWLMFPTFRLFTVHTQRMERNLTVKVPVLKTDKPETVFNTRSSNV